MKVILVSHGDFAAGLCSTLTNFFGAQNVYSACVSLETGAESLHSAVKGYLEQWGDEEKVVICSDIKGGSANQNAFQYLDRPNTFLVSGMNLSLCLQLMLKDDITIEELRDIVAEAKNDMVILNDEVVATPDDDE